MSYYIEKLDTASAQSIGCNQAHYDAGNGYRNSTITLDFGAQQGSSGTELPFYNTLVTYDQVESYAETVAYNYWACLGNDNTSILFLPIGTNTSGVVNSSGGSTWGAVVNAVTAYMSSNHYNQVVIWGGNDMELMWKTYAVTSSWETGYAGKTASLYTDYGDANSCPPYGSCYSGWNQHDVYLIAYGDSPAQVTPEIYYTGDGSEWESISDTQGQIIFWGPMDEYDLDSSTLTPAAAWSALGCGDSQTCEYSLQIHKAL